MLLSDLEILVEHWKERPPLADVVRAACGVDSAESSKSGRLPSGEQVRATDEMTQAEYDQMAALLRTSIEPFGVRRN